MRINLIITNIKIFYAEYGGYADREYMTYTDDWSRVIEGTHAIFCGLFALLAINLKTRGKLRQFNVALGVSMGSQLMNSILYMGEYFLQVADKDNENYNNAEFPTGIMLEKRGFMYVNIFWIIMPAYIMFYEIMNQKLVKLDDKDDEGDKTYKINYNLISDKDSVPLTETPPAYSSDNIKIGDIKMK